MELKIPQYTAMRWMVCDWDGPLRAFETKAAAEHFIAGRPEFTIKFIERKFKTITVEEALF